MISSKDNVTYIGPDPQIFFANHPMAIKANVPRHIPLLFLTALTSFIIYNLFYLFFPITISYCLHYPQFLYVLEFRIQPQISKKYSYFSKLGILRYREAWFIVLFTTYRYTLNVISLTRYI